MATAKTATKDVEVTEAHTPDNSKARIEHVVYTLTESPNVAGGIPATQADARMTDRIQSGQSILHMSSTPYVDTITREEIGTRVFVVFQIPG